MMKTLRRNLLVVLFAVLFVVTFAFAMVAPNTAKMEGETESESVFMMDYGAYARIKVGEEQDNGGLRFRVKFTDDVKLRVDAEEVTMGFAVMTRENYDAIADKSTYEFATAEGEGIWQVAVDENKIYTAKDQLTKVVYNYSNLLIRSASDFDTEYAVIAYIAENGEYEYADFEEGTNVKSLYYGVNKTALSTYFDDMVNTYGSWFGKDYEQYPVKVSDAEYQALVEYKDAVKDAGLKVVFASDVEDSENIKTELGAKYNYNVNFANYNGQTSSVTVLEGESIVTPATAPTLGDLTFDGWVNRDGSAMPETASANATYYTSWKVNSEEDFVAMLTAAKDASTQESGFTGYYKLTRDLDMSTVTGEQGKFMSSNNRDASKGWQATFDGDGYKIKKIGMSWVNNYNGIFGEIGTNGVIKNLAITDVMYDTSIEFKCGGGVVAFNNYGKIENVYVEVNFTNDGNWTSPASAIVSNNYSGGTITGCLVVDKSTAKKVNLGLIAGRTASAVDLSSNAYISTLHNTVNYKDVAPAKDAVKVDTVLSLFGTKNESIKAKLPMLTYDGKDIKWGKYKLVENVTLISSEEAFVNMLKAAKDAKDQAGGFTGHYVLTKDLDFTGVSVSGSMPTSASQDFTKNWQATFDGNGYALKNIVMSWITGTGLFGVIGTNGVIKNVAIIYPRYTSTDYTFKGTGGVIANNSAGKIYNVYVRVYVMHDVDTNAGLVRYCAGGSVTNCVVEYDSATTLANATLYVKAYANTTITNCYAITSAGFTNSGIGKTVANISALYNTATGLSMLKLAGSDVMWGNYKIGTYTA